MPFFFSFVPQNEPSFIPEIERWLGTGISWDQLLESSDSLEFSEEFIRTRPAAFRAEFAPRIKHGQNSLFLRKLQAAVSVSASQSRRGVAWEGPTELSHNPQCCMGWVAHAFWWSFGKISQQCFPVPTVPVSRGLTGQLPRGCVCLRHFTPFHHSPLNYTPLLCMLQQICHSQLSTHCASIVKVQEVSHTVC